MSIADRFFRRVETAFSGIVIGEGAHTGKSVAELSAERSVEDFPEVSGIAEYIREGESCKFRDR